MGAGAARAPDPPADLGPARRPRPGEVARGELPPGGAIELALRLRAGELLELLADQAGADVALAVEGPDGRALLRLDTPVGREEPEDLPLVAEAEGTYRVAVESLERSTPGRYRLEVTALRPATGRDRLRARAVASLAAGHELRRGGAWADAAVAYQGAAEAWRLAGEPGRQADSLEWAARCFSHQGFEGEAAELLARSVEGFRVSGMIARQAEALEELGTARAHLGRMEDATARYREALELWRKLGERSRQARTLTEIANLHKAADELGAAEVEYKDVLDLWRALGRGRDVAITRADLAGIYSITGQPQLALDLLERSAAELGAAASPDDLAFVLEESGLAHRKLGQRRQAIAAYEQALRLLRRAGSRDGEATALEGLARLHYEAGDYVAARKLYHEALARPEARGETWRSATLLDAVAWADLRGGRPAAALPLFRQALQTLRETRFPAGEAAVLAGIARVERALGHLEAAADWAERSLEAIEELRAGADRIDLRSALLASHQDAFDFAVDTLMELDRGHPGEGFAARAFDVAERAKARRLLDALPEVPGTARAAGSASSGRNPRLDALSRRVDAAEEARLRLLDAGAPGPELARAEEGLRSALEELRAAEDRLRPPGSGPVSEAGSTPRPLRLDEIQRRVLAPDVLLLSYDLGPERSYLWAVSKDRLESFVLPPGAALEREARVVSRLQAERDGSVRGPEAADRTEELSARLLGPVASELGGHRRLLVSLEGALHTVSLGALPEPGRSGEPVLANHEITYVPSASAAAWLGAPRRSDRAPEPGRLLAVVADPVFGADDPRLRSLGASSSAVGAGASVLAGRDLPRLPNTEHEADALLALVRPPTDARGFRGFAARKQLATSGALSGYRILHFATHSWASSEQPELSALVLSRIDSAGRPLDGVLWAHEIATLHLSADLVVLSACDSGLGTAIHGEGLVGLSDAFFRAGVPRVVASLWRVDDEAAAELMRRFYQGFLRRGLPAAESLRRAQLAIRAERRWRRPYYWAGFVLEGAR